MNDLFAFEESLGAYERRLIQQGVCPLTMRGMTQTQLTAVLRDCVNLCELDYTIYGFVQRSVPARDGTSRSIKATETYAEAFERIFGEPFDPTTTKGNSKCKRSRKQQTSSAT